MSIGVTTISADNGIYVLYTESEKGPEYRVAYAQSIGNIYGKWNDETARYDGDPVAIKEYFGGAPVFYTLNEAMDFAELEDSDQGVTEDGICVINEFKDYGHIFER